MDSQDRSKESSAILMPPPSPYTPLLAGKSASPTRRRHFAAALAAVSLAALVGVTMFLVVALRVDNAGKSKTPAIVSSVLPANATVSSPVKTRPPAAVARGVAEGVSNKSFGPSGVDQPFIWTDDMLSWQRTAFHFQPMKNWMNGMLHYSCMYIRRVSPKRPASQWDRLGPNPWGHGLFISVYIYIY